MQKYVNQKYIDSLEHQSQIYFSLDKYFDDSIYNINEIVPQNKEILDKKIIWMLWWQGIENMPELVWRCYESVLKNKPEGYEVIVLSESTYSDYIHFPTYIIDKFNNKIIPIQQFSDLIRTELLCMYGGAWIDATVYCCDKIPAYMIDSELFFFHGSRMDCPVIKLSNWWIAAKRNNTLLCTLRNFLLNYWRTEDVLVDYFIFHIAMSKLIDENKEFDNQFRAMPYFNNSNAHVLVSLLYDEFTVGKMQMTRDASVIQKLTYKEYKNVNGKYTFYDYVLGKTESAQECL